MNKEEETLDKIIELNGCSVALKPMHLPGTKTLINGVNLDYCHLFGIPNRFIDPYMVFYTNETPSEKNTGVFFTYFRAINNPYWKKIYGVFN